MFDRYMDRYGHGYRYITEHTLFREHEGKVKILTLFVELSIGTTNLGSNWCFLVNLNVSSCTTNQIIKQISD